MKKYIGGNMQKFIFPLNYKYSTKFLGIISYSILLPFSIYGALLITVFYIFKIDFFLSFGLFIILVLPPFLLLSVGINNQPALSYITAVYKFYKNSKLYLYKND